MASNGQSEQLRARHIEIENQINTYRLVDTQEKLKIALRELRISTQRSRLISVDCQGIGISRRGNMTLLNVAVKGRAYMFDVLRLGRSVFDRGLQNILEDSSIEKLMFNCSNASDALFHIYNVKLNNVLDLQLLEIMKRGGHILKSFKECLGIYIKDPAIVRTRCNVTPSPDVIKRRPISEQLLEYCSVDVLCLFTLYDRLCPSRNELEHLRSASDIYCDLLRSQRIRSYDKLIYLPQGIL